MSSMCSYRAGIYVTQYQKLFVCFSHQVGFQFFEYARKFFVTVKRILGLDYTFLPSGAIAIEYAGRNVMVKVSHVQISFEEVM